MGKINFVFASPFSAISSSNVLISHQPDGTIKWRLIMKKSDKAIQDFSNKVAADSVTANIPPSSVTSTDSNGVSAIASLRLKNLSYGSTLGLKKVLTTVPVKKPSNTTFFRVRKGEEWEFQALTFEVKDANETYILSPEVAEMIAGNIRRVTLYLAADKNGNPFLISVTLPDEFGRRNMWQESLLQALIIAQTYWVRVMANMKAGYYDVTKSQSMFDEPVWPEKHMEELVEIAFRGKIIDSPSHPLIQDLLGLA